VPWISGIVAVAALALGAAAGHAASQSLPLSLVANVPLPGPSSRFDYTSLDATTNRLYVAHMDAGQLLVFDLRRRRVVRTIAAPGVHGVLAVPSLHRVFASATDARQLLTIDAATGRVIGRAPAGAYPDGIAYDPVERRVFVSDETGGIESVFDARGRRVATVPLGGEAGNVQYDPVARRVLVDVQSRNEVAVIDPRSDRIVRRVALPGCDHGHGLLVDAPRRLAFVACDGNARLLTLDLTRMKVAGSVPVGASPDVLAFDTSLKRLYVSSEVGDVAVLAERGKTLTKLGQGLLAPFAHSVAVDPRTQLVYFPLQSGSAGRPELRIMRPS
jgi:DNA-binding beta-propeller fold protein YncE